MPRNPAGVYILPNPPVITDTTILSTDENTTRDDLAVEITNSLDRSGRGPMLAPVRVPDGSAPVPVYSWTSEQNSGWYRAAATDFRFAIGGVDVIRLTPAGVFITPPLAGVFSGLFQAANGAVGAPAYSWVNELTSGWYRAGAGDFRFAIGGVDALKLTPSGLAPLGQFFAPDGTVLLPGFAWQNEVNSGWYRAAAQDFRYSIAGVDVLKMTPATVAVLNTLTLGALGFTSITPPALAVNTPDYNPAGLATAGMLRLSSTADVFLGGIVGGTTGRILTLHNVGLFKITLSDEGSGSAPANRFALVEPVPISPDQVVTIQYDSTSQRWRAAGSVAPAAPLSPMQPLNVNPDLAFDQINEGALFYLSTVGGFNLDGWAVAAVGPGQFSIQRASPVPTKHAMQLGVSIVQGVLGANDLYQLYTAVEGNDMVGLDAGTAQAKSITVMLEFQSTALGLYSVCISNESNTLNYVTSFNVTNTNPNKYAVTIPLHTSGAWNFTNGVGLYCRVTLAAGANSIGAPGVWTAAPVYAVPGQVNFMAAANVAYIYRCHIIPSPVELPFQAPNHAEQLLKCQRYYSKSYNQGQGLGTITNGGAILAVGSAGNVILGLSTPFKASMRVPPTMTAYNPSTGAVGTWIDGAGTSQPATLVPQGTDSFWGYISTGSFVQAYGHWTANSRLS